MRTSSNHFGRRLPFEERSNRLQILEGTSTFKSSGADDDDGKGWTETKETLEQVFREQAEQKIKRLRKEQTFQIPPKHLNAQLFAHQKDGLRWLVHQEQKGEHLFQYDDDRSHWKCLVNNQKSKTEPPKIRGGILADGKSEKKLNISNTSITYI